MAKRTLLALAFIITMVAIPFSGRAWTMHYFGRNLGYGATGTEVSFLQEYLTEQGYFHYPSITEYFGPVTFGAVKVWQAANGIPNTGFFGPISRAFVNATDTPAVVTTTPTTTITTTDPAEPPASGTIISCWIPNACGNVNIIAGGVSVSSATSTASSTSSPSVTVTPSTTTMLSGATTTFTATFTNDDGDAAMWSAYGGGTINPVSGAYTAPTVYATTTVTVTATSQIIDSVNSSATVTVVPRPITISMAPTSMTLASGSVETFDATVSNATNTAVTWSALYGLINASGTYTAPSVVTSSLTDIITATSVASSSLIATATVTVVPGGMAVWLPLDEGTGAVANDISGNGNNGAWSGTMASASGTYYAPGIVGNYSGVFSQDGTTKISLTSPSALVGNAAKTISLWFNASDLRGTEQDIAEFGDNTGGGQFGLDLGSDNHITGHLGGTDFESSILPTTSTWYFAALTYNGSVTSLYVNGTLEATSSATVNTGDANFFIGQHLAYTGLYFAGDVDDVRVYTRALSQGELQEIYNATVPPITISISPTSTYLIAQATTTFVANVMNATNTAVTWSAEYGTITASGTYTAPTLIGSSTVTDVITATSQANNAVVATTTVTVSSDLLGWWPINEGTSSIAYDQSGSGNNASWAGTQDGPFGYYASDTFNGSPSYAGYLNGVDNSISRAGIASLKFGTGDFSVSFWLRALQWGGVTQGVIGEKANDSDNGWQIYNDSGTDTSDIGIRIGSTQQSFYSHTAVAVNTWQLWTFVRSNGVGYWYLNGTQDATSSFAWDASSASGNFSIGYAQTWSAYCNAYINDMRVYGRALSPTEVENIYNLGQPVGGYINVITNPAA